VAVPKFEEFKAPWEIDSAGNPIEPDKQEIDSEKFKKHLWNLLNDKDKAQTARDTALTQIGTLTTERDALKSAADTKANEGKTELQKLQESINALTTRAETAEFEKTKMQVITDKKIRPEAASLLQGKTEAELLASADQLVALGLVVPDTNSTDSGEGEGQGAGQGNPLNTTPKQRLNPGDPKPEEGGEMSVDDFVKQAESSAIRF
jgi:hypothetical protein